MAAIARSAVGIAGESLCAWDVLRGLLCSRKRKAKGGGGRIATLVERPPPPKASKPLLFLLLTYLLSFGPKTRLIARFFILVAKNFLSSNIASKKGGKALEQSAGRARERMES